MSTRFEKSNDDWILIVSGYLRRTPEKWKLYVPKEIEAIIYMFSHQVRTFNLYNRKKFAVSNNEYILTPIAEPNNYCNGYMVFPSPNGFSRGIHEWTVLYKENNGDGDWSYKSIGIVSKIENDWIRYGIESNPWPTNDKYASYWDGFKDWKENEIIRVIVDLITCKIKYYKKQRKGKDYILIKQDTLWPDEKYYFAVCCDADKTAVVLESV